MTVTDKDARQWYDALLTRNPPQRLRPRGPWDAALSERIAAAPWGAGRAAEALKAALLLWNDDLDASHKLAQGIPDATGSLIHGIMHRMEGDYWNAEYWFRRTGAHPLYREIAAAVRGAEPRDPELAAAASPYVENGAWNPYAFNRAVQRALEGGGGNEAALEAVQRLEMSVVAQYCIRECFGGRSG